jgi:hypothetical protein
MVASSANNPTSSPAFVSAGKTKAIPYKRLEHRDKAWASPSHSKSIFWSAQTCLRFVLGFETNGEPDRRKISIRNLCPKQNPNKKVDRLARLFL